MMNSAFMRCLHTVLIGFLSVGLLSGCHKSGTWIDDSGNWKRAFGRPQPKELQVVHSIYWRTPHFTREDGWTFQIKSPPSIYKEWLAAYKVKHPDSAELQRLESLKNDKPSWFLPKPMSNYEIWVLDEPDSNFALFIDQSTGEWFVTDSGY
jgi:hypothetical protein